MEIEMYDDTAISRQDSIRSRSTILKAHMRDPVNKHMSFLDQKILLNFLFNQVILHKCEILRKEAIEKAKMIY